MNEINLDPVMFWSRYLSSIFTSRLIRVRSSEIVSFMARDPVFSVRRRTKFILTLLSAVIGAYVKFCFFDF